MEIERDSVKSPKRGDLMQSNMGNRRERTWFILRSIRMTKSRARRYAIFRARWWELEPEMRLKLFASAERNGGQVVWHTHPLNKPKRINRKIEDLY